MCDITPAVTTHSGLMLHKARDKMSSTCKSRKSAYNQAIDCSISGSRNKIAKLHDSADRWHAVRQGHLVAPSLAAKSLQCESASNTRAAWCLSQCKPIGILACFMHDDGSMLRVSCSARSQPLLLLRKGHTTDNFGTSTTNQTAPQSMSRVLLLLNTNRQAVSQSVAAVETWTQNHHTHCVIH